ncbi:conserved phage C-terminal domain-containing protein [Paenibacillus farraposensis]|uniref:Conserved phage C-terminal domain-containing protein n=1 Tax=Paenibacillus farraposensis TaxID=2807095 RepID=A0ABW4DCX0_9BACL|nr:conserved phage C-terminal domain-containing protein [Paenibacillus farraposensis]MCC3379859.1 conserved phage C-terminal domain-containing protein [Paenibacillus farraposensis]
MAGPELDNGYTRVANEIYEEVAMRKFNGIQLRMLLIVWRYTYGFNRKSAELSATFLATALRSDLSGTKKELKKLLDMHVLKVFRQAQGKHGRMIGFNKYYERWLVGCNPPPQPLEPDESTGGESHPLPVDDCPPHEGEDCTPKKESINKTIKKGEIVLPSIHEEIISYLNEKTGKNYNFKVKTTKEFINGRISEGRTVEDFKNVIDIKCSHWLNDPKMSQYLRPATLFRPSNFDNYLNQEPEEKEGDNPGQMSKDEKIDYDDAIREWVMKGNDPADFRFDTND